MINSNKFGVYEGQEVFLYTLSNSAGMEVKIMNYGATITSVSIPGSEGSREELVCGFDSFEAYFSPAYTSNSPYFGGTVGRFASRLKDGKFSLQGKDYQLATNDGPNHLHGGLRGFDKRMWELKEQNSEKNQLTLSLFSPDGEEGFPGNLQVELSFTLGEDNDLSISYAAHTDQDSPISLTNHSYFNLSGFKEDLSNHKVQIATEQYLVPDESNVPVGPLAKSKALGFDLKEGVEMTRVFESLPDGFEHYFIFDQGEGLQTVAEISHPASSRRMVVRSTEPGMLFYTGMYTSDELKRENGDQFGKFRGLCCETHRYPNGPNIPSAPGAITPAGETYRSTTTFTFSF